MNYEHEVEVDKVLVKVASAKRVVVLKHKSEPVYIPIWVGTNEADAIALKLSDETPARPMTHDLLANTLKTLGGKLESVVVNKLQNNTLYAFLRVAYDSRIVEIDARPSDAIALAVRIDVPIFVFAEVIDKLGIEIENDTKAGKTSKKVTLKNQEMGQNLVGLELATPVGKEEKKRLSSFSSFIGTLDLDSIGRRIKDERKDENEDA